MQAKKKKEKMNEKSGDREEADASSSPTAETAAAADAKEADAESEVRAAEQSSIENEAKEAAEPVAAEVADEVAPPTDLPEAKSPAKSTQEAEQTQEDAGQSVESTAPEPAPSSSSATDDAPAPLADDPLASRLAADDPLASKLAKVVKTDSEADASAGSSPLAAESASKEANPSTLSTENLISMLEGSADKESPRAAKDAADSQPAAPAVDSAPQTSASQSASASKATHSISDLPPPKLNRKYIYKLKSKTGKVLKYVSSVPIVLKRPVISLTKMADDEVDRTDDDGKNEAAGKAARGEADDADSDNSTKENNVKANDASKGTTGLRIARKRGRPPLLQKAPVITLDDGHSPDEASDGKESFKGGAGGSGSASSYGVQTRKRQLKFLPDGRMVTPAGKKYKSAAAAAAVAASSSKAAAHDETQSSDTDILTESDDGSQSDRKVKKLAAAAKLAAPVEKKGASKKEFDYESYFREKSAAAAEAKAAATKKAVETPKSAPAKAPGPPRNNAATPGANKAAPAPTNNAQTPTSANKNAVDPAQLLSSLIGVSIFPHQLNVVKFKPKVIQDRKTMSAQKNVTFVDETSGKKSVVGSQSQQSRNTPFRVSAKPSLQKILPKPVSTPDRSSSLIRKPTETPRSAPSAAARLAATTSKLNAALTSPITYASSSYRYGPAGDAAKFENFTDTKVVKTKEGPKKLLKRKDEPVDEAAKTVYDLMQNVFEQLPSWNLHVIPDTNSFCIAQVSRGRMGIPILKKSIELNADFAAKVYVHQLHCKKYDGVYDTENKILSLIREIDALAA